MVEVGWPRLLLTCSSRAAVRWAALTSAGLLPGARRERAEEAGHDGCGRPIYGCICRRL